jgi:hypothetical protein
MMRNELFQIQVCTTMLYAHILISLFVFVSNILFQLCKLMGLHSHILYK